MVAWLKALIHRFMPARPPSQEDISPDTLSCSSPALSEQTVQEIMAHCEAKVARTMQHKAVVQDFFGGLHVRPQDVFIGRKEGQAALERLQDLAHVNARVSAPSLEQNTSLQKPSSSMPTRCQRGPR